MLKSPAKKPASLKDEFSPEDWGRFKSLLQSAAKLDGQLNKPTPPQPKAAVKKKTKKKDQ